MYYVTNVSYQILCHVYCTTQIIAFLIPLASLPLPLLSSHDLRLLVLCHSAPFRNHYSPEASLPKPLEPHPGHLLVTDAAYSNRSR